MFVPSATVKTQIYCLNATSKQQQKKTQQKSLYFYDCQPFLKKLQKPTNSVNHNSSASLTESSGWVLFQRIWEVYYSGEKESF